MQVDSTIYDVLIIGAGPCGLAVASRLREQTPSAMFTDEEQQRYHWMKKHRDRMSIKNKKTLLTSQVTTERSDLSMLVLDASGDKWMTRWDHLFRTYEISHLRSPMFFHVDPRDRDGLLGYTHEQERAGELLEIGACVGKERSKHQRKKDRKGGRSFHEPAVDERDRKDYHTPSTSLFRCHCGEVERKYQLEDGMICNESVISIDYRDDEVATGLFNVSTDKGVHHARTVVLSVGAGNTPHIPGLPGIGQIDGACHASFIRSFPSQIVKRKISQRQKTNILIVGGGLTAAHLAVNAIRKGVGRVHMLIKSHLKVKPFDVDLAWMGKFRNLQQAYFWSADTDQERLRYIQDARNGGSITPRIHRVLKRLCAEGSLLIHEETEVESRVLDTATKTWDLKTTPEVDLPAMDYIYYATGSPTDISRLPYLQGLLGKHPIEVIGGLPCLTNDMAWSDTIPLYMTGKLASLRIGPGAGNLAGARIGAERIAWSIQEHLDLRLDPDAVEGRFPDNYLLGIGNRFEGLTGSETDESDDSSTDQSLSSTV